MYVHKPPLQFEFFVLINVSHLGHLPEDFFTPSREKASLTEARPRCQNRLA